MVANPETGAANPTLNPSTAALRTALGLSVEELLSDVPATGLRLGHSERRSVF